MVMRTRARLVVIDSLREAHTGDENTSKDMAPIMRQIRALTQPTGAAVIVVHHTVKNADVSDLYRARGSSAIVAAADAAIMADAGVALWCKTRGWKMADDEKKQPFEIIDLDKGPTVVRPRKIPQLKPPKKGKPG
jgi:RecA-family ATPase